MLTKKRSKKKLGVSFHAVFQCRGPKRSVLLNANGFVNGKPGKKTLAVYRHRQQTRSQVTFVSQGSLPSASLPHQTKEKGRKIGKNKKKTPAPFFKSLHQRAKRPQKTTCSVRIKKKLLLKPPLNTENLTSA